MKNAIVSLAPADIPRLNEVDISAGVLIFAFFISLVTGFLFGLVPAFQAARAEQIENLREGGRGSGLGRRHTRLSRALVVAEVALSIVLLAGAGPLAPQLLARPASESRLQSRTFDDRADLDSAIQQSASDPFSVEEKRADFLLEVSRRVAAIPGIEQSSISGNDTLPMNSGRNYSLFTITGRPDDAITPAVRGYRRHRHTLFPDDGACRWSQAATSPISTHTKREASPSSIERLAKQYWPDSDPIGQELKFNFGRGLQGLTIVGIAGDIKSDGYESPSVPHIYVALGQFAPVNAVVFLRTREHRARLNSETPCAP